MKKVQKLQVEYVGISSPENDLEVDFEVAGLESVMCEIKSRIAKLRQAQQLNRLLEAENETNQQQAG